MQVYVVMGNDFPDSVFSSQAEAGAYVAKRQVGTLVELILEGVRHTDPDVRGFFINYVRDRESRREIPF
jgi:hypothetical protein